MTLYSGTVISVLLSVTFLIIPNICFVMATEHQLTFQWKSLSQQQNLAAEWQWLSQCTLFVYETRIVFSSSHHFAFSYAEFHLALFFLLFHLSHATLLQFFAVRSHATLNNLVSSSNFLTPLLTLLYRSLITILSRTIPCPFPCRILLLTSLYWEN